MSYKHRIGMGASIFLGIIFLASGIGKLLSTSEGFKEVFNPFPGFIPSAFTESVAIWLPYVEVILGLLLVLCIVPRFASLLSALLIAGFITNNAWLLSRGLGYEPCTCFGVLDRLVGAEISTNGSLYLDIIMLAMVATVVLLYNSNFFNLRPWSYSGGERG